MYVFIRQLFHLALPGGGCVTEVNVTACSLQPCLLCTKHCTHISPSAGIAMVNCDGVLVTVSVLRMNPLVCHTIATSPLSGDSLEQNKLISLEGGPDRLVLDNIATGTAIRTTTITIVSKQG